jgi:hypothetical protein
MATLSRRRKTNRLSFMFRDARFVVRNRAAWISLLRTQARTSIHPTTLFSPHHSGEFRYQTALTMLDFSKASGEG